MQNANNNIKTIELLAPAKDLACGIAAINHGADAVYIGAAKFGARHSAGRSEERRVGKEGGSGGRRGDYKKER